MALMTVPLGAYAIEDTTSIITPALLIYPELVDANIQTTLRILGNDEKRWRPHVKTSKLGAVLQRLVVHGVTQFKCSTTLELQTACASGATDVLVALAVVGANARRTVEIAQRFPAVRVSVLVESHDAISLWDGTGVGLFIDLNPGMNRTGIAMDRVDEIRSIAKRAGQQFRGLHYYDGHMSAYSLHERERPTHAGYDRLMEVVEALESSGVEIEEVITSGTPSFPFALTYQAFKARQFRHTVSPGTVVYCDFVTLKQLPHEYGYVPAALVLSTVISQPSAHIFTCDGGHKSVSADAGVPTCMIVGHDEWTPAKPSEEHLPVEIAANAAAPKLGDGIYLFPRHVCPTVNNFDQALFVKEGQVVGIENVTARGHEVPLSKEAIAPSASAGRLTQLQF
jgi:D-serine deaminase-like pyridoxal phosphate-dependent protein